MASSLLKSFRGGVHPDEHKELTENLPFETMDVPEEVYLPISQHIGRPAKPLVKKGDDVVEGQVIAEADGFISSPVHSTITGKVKNISKAPHASGFPKESIIVQKPKSKPPKEGEEAEPEEPPKPVRMEVLNPETVSAEDIKKRVQEAGIVGQGGAAFPTFVKFSPPEGKTIDFILINGAECEPYLTRDYRFMLERTEDVVQGLQLIMKAAGVDRGVIGIENNKPEAIKKISEVCEKYPAIDVQPLKTKYPQGAEKMLIEAITGRRVPPGKLPLDVGVVVQNVGTAIAVLDAVTKGIPALTAAVTVTGGGITTPKNLIVPIGTPIQAVLDYCGGLKPDAKKVIVGGPMMGVAQYDLSAPVMKATSGILALSAAEVSVQEETACLRCGKCVDVCPIDLVPTKLARYAQMERWEEAENEGVTVCMECGSCAFTCPAHIPLVQWLKLGKQKVMTLQRQRQTA